MTEESSRAWKDQYMLRLPDGMRDRIKDAAAANNRSMNAEIIATLEEAYPVPEFDVEGTTMTEWLNYVDAADHPDERRTRIHEVNLQLRFSPRHNALEVRVFEEGENAGKAYITVSKRTDIEAKGPFPSPPFADES